MPCFRRCFYFRSGGENKAVEIYLTGWVGKNALGIAEKSPQRSEDLQRKARPDKGTPTTIFQPTT